MLYMLVFSLGFVWRCCFGFPYDQHIHPCDPIPDMDVSTCQGLCSGCRSHATLWPDTGRKKDIPINILQNRPSRLSSVRICTGSHEADCHCKNGNDWRQLQACGANNGLIDKFISTNCLGYPYNCVHTLALGYLDAAWWFADMEKPVSVSNVVIYAFSPFSEGIYQVSPMFESMAGIRFYVDAKRCAETAKTLRDAANGYVDWKFPNNTKLGPGIRFVYWCEGVKRGRYFRIQKLPDAEWAQLQFCEAQIFACPSGTYAMASTWQEMGSFDCKPCSCVQYPCDNYYGCFPPKMAANKANNIIIQKYVEVLNSESSRPAEFLVDGVPEPADFRCYRSLYSRPDLSRHFARIDLGNLYQVIKGYIVNFAGYYNFYTQFQLWTARQNKEELCFQMDGVLGDALLGECRTCSTGLNDCPRATSATFRDGGNSDYLALCELELYGFPMKEIPRGGPCSDCHLELCAKGLQCEERICKAKIGDPCSKDIECQSAGICECQQCKLPLNGDCSQLPNMCASGLECFKSMCKMSLNSGPCSSNDDCSQYMDDNNNQNAANTNSFSSYECDYNKKCKIPQNSSCLDDGDCAAGTSCEARYCACTSVLNEEDAPTVILGQNGTCEPLYFNKPCPDDNGCGNTTITKFQCNNGVCVCQEGFAIHERDFSCHVGFGQECSLEEHMSCSSGMVCEDTKKCRLEKNSECDPVNEGECKKGTVCDQVRKRCFITNGAICESSNQCKTGSICESNKCVIARGGKCKKFGTPFCQTGLICAIPAGAAGAGHHCVQVIGGTCEKDEHCPNGTICEQGLCIVDILQTCNSSTPCRQYAECIQGQCSLKIGSTCSRGRSECGPDAVCDFDKRCRYKLNNNCNRFPAFCQQGSLCNENKRCECLSIAPKASETCELSNSVSLVTSKCEITQTETETRPCAEALYAKCDPETKTCVCNDDYASTGHLECKPSVGFPCAFFDQNSSAANQDRRCAEHAVCEYNLCRLPVGQVCVGRERLYCISGAFCDKDDLCRLIVGSKCGNDLSSHCELGTVCDQFQKCKLPTGANCTTNTSCVVGAKCKKEAGDSYSCKCDNDLSSPSTSTQGLCVINAGLVGGECYLARVCKEPNAVCTEANICKCREGFEVSEIDLSCKVDEGFPCRDNHNCTSGNVCDIKLLVCKRALGSYCVGKTNSTNCDTEAMCDDLICRIPQSGTCAAEERRTHCMLGTVCDILGVCKKGFNYRCNASYECGAGMICLNNTCACNKIATRLSSGWCSPLRGRIGSSCSPEYSVRQCTVQGSFCDEDTGSCQCQDSPVISQNLSCLVASASEEKNESPLGLTILFIIPALIILVAILLAVVYIVKGDKENSFVVLEMKERQQRIQELKTDFDDFESRVQLSETPLITKTVPLDNDLSSKSHPVSPQVNLTKESEMHSDESELSSREQSPVNLTDQFSAVSPDLGPVIFIDQSPDTDKLIDRSSDAVNLIDQSPDAADLIVQSSDTATESGVSTDEKETSLVSTGKLDVNYERDKDASLVRLLMWQ